ESYEAYGDRYTYPDPYVHSKTKIRIICAIHGEFFQLPLDHRRGHGCADCGFALGRISGPVYRIMAVLDRLGIAYKNEVTMEGLKYIKSLHLDIDIPGLKGVIEYDGGQHFKPVARWGGEPELVQIKLRDKIKDAYLTSRGISLVRIPVMYNDALEESTEAAIKLMQAGPVYASYGDYIEHTRSLGVDLSKYTVINLL
nr:hypothetical protein [Nitrosomonas sp.]